MEIFWIYLNLFKFFWLSFALSHTTYITSSLLILSHPHLILLCVISSLLILFHPCLYLLSHITSPVYLCWFHLIFYYFLLCYNCTLVVFLTFSHYTIVAIIHFTDIILVSLLSPLSYNYLFNPYNSSNPTYISPFHILHSPADQIYSLHLLPQSSFVLPHLHHFFWSIPTVSYINSSVIFIHLHDLPMVKTYSIFISYYPFNSDFSFIISITYSQPYQFPPSSSKSILIYIFYNFPSPSPSILNSPLPLLLNLSTLQ